MVARMKKERNSGKSNRLRNVSGAGSIYPLIKNLLEAIPLPLFHKDDSGIYRACNRKFEEITGKKTGDIIGRKSGDLFSSDIAAIYDSQDEQTLQKGTAHTYEAALPGNIPDTRILIFHKFPLCDPSGTPRGLIGSIFDITGRKEYELKLRNDEDRYRRIFENIQDVYYEVNMEGVILEISPSVEKFSSFKREDIIGQSIYNFYADKDERKAFLQAINQKGYVHDFEIKLIDSAGSLRTCSVNAAILPGDEEHPPLIVGSLRDISERKLSEEKLRQSEEELSIKSRNLEEMNTALRVLLKQREEDRKENEENVLTNVKTAVIPCLEKFKEQPLTDSQKTCLEMMETKINEVVSPFIHRLYQAGYYFTSQELRIADFIREGRTTKEIAALLGISVKTVDYHRDNIRKKLGIRDRRTGLRSYLLKFQ